MHRNANTGRPYTPADYASLLLLAAEDHARLTAAQAENDETPYDAALPHDEDGLREERADLLDRFAALATAAGPLLRTLATDREALDDLAVMLGTAPEWNGADDLESIANVIGRTERPHPGDASDSYREEFAKATRRIAPDRYGHDDEDEEHVHYVAKLWLRGTPEDGPRLRLRFSRTRDGILDAIEQARHEDHATLDRLHAEEKSGTRDGCLCTRDDVAAHLAATEPRP